MVGMFVGAKVKGSIGNGFGFDGRRISPIPPTAKKIFNDVGKAGININNGIRPFDGDTHLSHAPEGQTIGDDGRIRHLGKEGVSGGHKGFSKKNI